MKPRSEHQAGAALAILAVAMIVVAALPVASSAGVITVSVSGGGDYTTLGGAFAAAADGDTILVRPGVYLGADNRGLDFAGRSLTVRSTDGPEQTRINCKDEDRAFIVDGVDDPPATIEGLTIQYAHAHDDTVWTYDGYGGAVYCYASSVTLANMIFRENSCDQSGGAVFMSGGGAYEILGCDFIDNSAPEVGSDGGAVLVNASDSFTLDNSDFVGNTAVHGGGALRVEIGVPVTVSDARFVGNEADFGGAISMSSVNGEHTIDGCLFEGNTARHWGGALSLVWGSMPTIRNCAFLANVSRYKGSALGLSRGAPGLVERCTFWQNETQETDGATISFWDDTSVIRDCTFLENSAPTGGVLYCDGGASPTVGNCIFAFTSAGRVIYCDGDDCEPELAFSCVYENAGGDTMCGDVHELIFEDPLVCLGSLPDFTLEDCSPCIGAGEGGTTIGAGEPGCPCGDPTTVIDTPDRLVFLGATPNPANETVGLHYSSGITPELSASIFTAAGRLVRVLKVRPPSQGRGVLEWDGLDSQGRRVAPGVYFVEMRTAETRARGEVVLLR